MRIPNKFNGYSADNRRLYNMGGGGGGPNTTYSQTSNIPEYARPYVEQMLGATQRQLFTGTNDASGNFVPSGFNNFTPYGATFKQDAQGNPIRDASGNVLYTNTAQQQAQAAVAPVSAGQQMATNSINQYVAPSQTGGATAIAGDIAGRSAASGYYSPLQAERFQLGTPQQVRTDSFTAPYVSQAYMSPYMQNVVNAQQREARRASDIQRNQQQAQAVGQGAFGGSRQGIVEAERQRNLATQLGDIQAQGLQGAYQQGMGQFNAEQQAYLAAQQANQGANLQAGIQNLQSQQQAQAAQEASRQFGAQLGLQGYGQSLQAAQTLGSLGQQQYQQDMGTIQAMAGMGAQEQAQTQNIINQAMQNYGTAQQYPLMQLGVMSNMLRGLPMQSSTTNMYQAQPSYLSQAAGALGTGLGLYQQGQKAGLIGGKEGGVVKMAAGGIATGVSAPALQARVKGPSFDDKELAAKAQDPATDQATKDIMTAEIARRAGLRAGMATGGIVAFKKGSKKSIKESTEQKAEDITLPEADVGGEGILKTITPKAPEPPAVAPLTPEERRVAIRQSYVGGQPQPKAEAPSQLLPNPDFGAETVPAAARSKPSVNEGISAAPNKMLSNVNQLYSDVEAANLEAGLDARGNKIGAEADPADAAIEEHIGSLKKQQSPLQDVMNKSKADLVKSYQKEREEMNLPDPANRERELFEARKTRGQESEKETARNNLIRFLTKWGTIPGSTMRGLIGAGADLIDKMDVDEKHRQKFLNEMDDIESRINNAEYSRRLGDEDRARKEKDEAGKLYYKLASDITEVRLKEALKDKDVRKAIAVEQYKIKREEAKGPKGEEYMVGVYSKALTAANPKKYPPGPETDGIAAQMYMRDKPGVLAAGMNLPYHETIAGASSSQASTAAAKATTDAGTAKGAQATQFEKDLRAKIAIGDVATEISKANKEDPKGEKGLVKAIRERVRKEMLNSGNYPLLVTPAAPAAAPAAAPKKDDKNKGGGWGDLKVK
jgi:hypothetical protein